MFILERNALFALNNVVCPGVYLSLVKFRTFFQSIFVYFKFVWVITSLHNLRTAHRRFGPVSACWWLVVLYHKGFRNTPHSHVSLSNNSSNWRDYSYLGCDCTETVGTPIKVSNDSSASSANATFICHASTPLLQQGCSLFCYICIWQMFLTGRWRFEVRCPPFSICELEVIMKSSCYPNKRWWIPQHADYLFHSAKINNYSFHPYWGEFCCMYNKLVCVCTYLFLFTA